MKKFKPSEDYEGLLRQANALSMLCQSQEEMIKHYSKEDFDTRKGRIKALEYSIESEREMNSQLTKEIEGLKVENKLLRFDCHDLETKCLGLALACGDNSALADVEMEKHNLTQQAKGVRGYIKHVESVTEMVNQTDINCSEQYISQLLEQAKGL